MMSWGEEIRLNQELYVVSEQPGTGYAPARYASAGVRVSWSST